MSAILSTRTASESRGGLIGVNDLFPREDAPPGLLDALDRFLGKLEEGEVPPADTGLDTPCWNWTAFRNDDGYGQFRVWSYRVSPMMAHVVAYLLFVGDRIPRKEEIHHRCENRACCRPDHLEKKPRGPHRAEHNRKPRKPNVIEEKEVIRDGRRYRLSVLEAPKPRRPGAGQRRTAA